MQAVILVGGEGTRLRPLTSLRPKPIVTLVDRPFIIHMIDWLKTHGVDDVIMSCGFLPDKMQAELGDGSDLGINLRFVTEPDLRGTAGALKYAEEFLQERFLMLNGDVLTDVDITAQIQQHIDTGATGTLALVPVDDPTSYGLVRLNDDNSVRGFLEKPKLEDIDTNLISAGIYVLERSVLDMIEPDRAVSIEKEIWPALVDNGLYGFADNNAYWMDIGTPDRYLQGTFDILEGRVHTAVAARLDASHSFIHEDIHNEGTITGPAVVESGVSIGERSFVGSLSVIGKDVTIGEGVTVERSVIMRGAVIHDNARIVDAVIAPDAVIGENTVVTGLAMVGEGSTVGAGNIFHNGLRLAPHAAITDNTITFK